MSLTESKSRAPRPADGEKNLLGPAADFWLLGGSSLVLLPILVLLPAEAIRPSLATIVFWLAVVINYPHFMASYSIFYEGYRTKITQGESPDPTLWARYLFAGVVVPIALVATMGAAIAAGNGALLGYGFNLMIFFVGWHYVKQGYGIAMVQAALKRRYFTAIEKKVLLANGYVIWMAAWVMRNETGDSNDFMGAPAQFWDFPDPFVWLIGAATAITTIATAAILARRFVTGTPTPWTGVIGYLVALYAWRLFLRMDLLVLLVAPALHSLQYLTVVKRYQLNRHEAGASRRSWRGLYWLSVGLGPIAFFVVPMTLDRVVNYDAVSLGTLPFSILFIVGINVHHYFLDNVMWRRSNPEVSQHLFS